MGHSLNSAANGEKLFPAKWGISAAINRLRQKSSSARSR
jgi:hypothetical protein